MEKHLVLAGYRFVALRNLPGLKEALKRRGEQEGITGTILLSKEGINVNLCGPEINVRHITGYLDTITGLKDMTYHESYTTTPAFTRFLVKLKKEIIPFGVEGINPTEKPAPFLEPETLHKWYKEKKNFILLDTRNNYEVRVGTFQNAIDLNIEHFKEFPKAVLSLLPHHKDTPIVATCTGGIRCEKAAPYMQAAGFTQVYQLKGGFLGYFKKYGTDFYEGDCFIFDKRVALTPFFSETGMQQCYRCRSPLSPEDLTHPSYEIDVSCPYCVDSERDNIHPMQDRNLPISARE